MSAESAPVIQLSGSMASSIQGVHIGRITGIDKDRRVWVDHTGNPDKGQSIPARVLAGAVPVDARQRCRNAPVLLAFEDNDPLRPIVVGLVHDTLDASRAELHVDPRAPKSARLDGRTVCLEAKETVTLRCGQASIQLKKDGKVVIKGVSIVNRASRTNKIKGASVSIN